MYMFIPQEILTKDDNKQTLIFLFVSFVVVTDEDEILNEPAN